ncbi:hypothetical protein [Vibrio renipiscarius]|nr:hypothetical protein [Vibrio renipiscarius]
MAHQSSIDIAEEGRFEPQSGVVAGEEAARKLQQEGNNKQQASVSI